MSAECPRCGHDLPYGGDCQLCALRAEADRLRAERDEWNEQADLTAAEVARLRAEAEKWKEEYEDVAHACRAAEREADRYREALAAVESNEVRWTAWLCDRYNLRTELEQVKAKRDRYREALERIAQPMPSDYPGPGWATARGIARAALEGSEGR